MDFVVIRAKVLSDSTGADAMVDANGVYYSRVRDFGWGGDSGWVVGALAYAPADGFAFSLHTIARTTLGGVTLEFGTTTPNIIFKCEAKWT